MSAAKRPAWLPDGCPARCADPDLHADRDHYEDRSHVSVSAAIILTAEEPIRYERETYDEPSQVDIYMIQHYREASPRIWLGRNQTSEGVHMTLTEAEQLANELLTRIRKVRP